MFFVDTEKLDNKMAERAETWEDMAAEMGISLNTFAHRIKCRKFLIGEIHKICSVLHLPPQESKAIFLCKTSIN